MSCLRILRKAVGQAATGALALHLVASVLQNTPDSYNQDMTKYTCGWPLPQWRFFAPNPGVQNVHLLVRKQSDDTSAGAWKDVTPAVSHAPHRFLWHPSSRGPKALFDAMQQLTIYQGSSARFDWVMTSESYRLVRDLAARRVQAPEGSTFQFMILNVEPSAPFDKQMKPILVSQPEKVPYE